MANDERLHPEIVRWCTEVNDAAHTGQNSSLPSLVAHGRRRWEELTGKGWPDDNSPPYYIPAAAMPAALQNPSSVFQVSGDPVKPQLSGEIGQLVETVARNFLNAEIAELAARITEVEAMANADDVQIGDLQRLTERIEEAFARHVETSRKRDIRIRKRVFALEEKTRIADVTTMGEPMDFGEAFEEAVAESERPQPDLFGLSWAEAQELVGNPPSPEGIARAMGYAATVAKSGPLEWPGPLPGEAPPKDDGLAAAVRFATKGEQAPPAAERIAWPAAHCQHLNDLRQLATDPAAPTHLRIEALEGWRRESGRAAPYSDCMPLFVTTLDDRPVRRAEAAAQAEREKLFAAMAPPFGKAGAK